MNPPILEAKNISKTFHYPKKIQILTGISLQIFPGESIAIVGRSGEGKSTLLQILGTLETTCSGSIYVDAQEVTSSNATQIRNTKIGFVFQDFHLLEDYTVLENVLMRARIARMSIGSGSMARKSACELLEKVGLADRVNYHTKLLSGGEKQRVALARAMCNDPSVILADEPSGNLDRDTAQIIHDLLLRFPQEEGKALLLVTHDRELAKRCTRNYELRNGQLHPIQ